MFSFFFSLYYSLQRNFYLFCFLFSIYIQKYTILKLQQLARQLAWLCDFCYFIVTLVQICFITYNVWFCEFFFVWGCVDLLSLSTSCSLQLIQMFFFVFNRTCLWVCSKCHTIVVGIVHYTRFWMMNILFLFVLFILVWVWY